ncbi:MAG TPA: CHC2 zinc finger domain-containing protein [Candidatus Limiplasma sp.]|nr:CHC2 zinc finger domain-containing protein [Candidatus Limiplasma sp.]
MSYKADAIKASVTVRQAAELYGLPFDRHGWAKCPFHHEKTASLKLYDGAKGWVCFGCHRGGSVIDLVMALKNITCDQAMVRLDSDFNLGIVGRKPTPYQRALEAQRERQRKELLRMDAINQERAEAEYDAAFRWWLLLQRLIDQNRPRDPTQEFDPLWAYAQQHINAAYDTVCRTEDRVKMWKSQQNQTCAT